VIRPASIGDDVDHYIVYMIAERISAEAIRQWCDRLLTLVDSQKEMPPRYPFDLACNDGAGRAKPTSAIT